MYAWFGAEAAQAQSLNNYGAIQTAANLQLLGGTAHVTVVRKHVAANLTLTSGTQTVNKFVPVHLDAPNMQFVGGTAHFFTTRKATAGNLSLLGGTSTPKAGRFTAHAAGHMSLLGGASNFTVSRRSTAANLALQGGNSTTTINIAVIEQEDIRRFDTDEQHPGMVGATSRREPLRLSGRSW